MKQHYTGSAKTLLAGLLLSVTSTVLAGGYIQAGSEYEYYPQIIPGNTTYHSLTSYNPYLRFSYRSQNSDVTWSGRVLFKQYPYRRDFANNTSTAQSGLYEIYVTDYIRSANFIFRPGIGIRIIPYHQGNYYGERYEHQLRILPQFDYLLTDTSRLYLNGFFYIADSKGSRKNDKVNDPYNNDCSADIANASGYCSKKYSDWGYEFDAGVRHNINDANSVSLGLHSYLYNVTNNYNDRLNQLTIDYQLRAGKLTIGSYVRLAIDRDISSKSARNPASNITLKQPYNRYGVRAVYAFTGRWAAGTEVYYQDEKRQDPATARDMPSRQKWFFKANAQYSF